jgi:hypothetical protein
LVPLTGAGNCFALCIQIRNCEYNMEVGGVPRANIISLCGDSDSSYMSPVQSE